MLRTILAALAFVGASVGANASTLRIDVVGSVAWANIGGAYSFDPATGAVGGYWSRNLQDVPQAAARHAEFLAATTGTATFVPGGRLGQFTSCAGLLVYLCVGQASSLDVDLEANTFRTSGFDTFYSSFSANQSGGTFHFDTHGSYQVDNMFLVTAGGGQTTLRASFTEVSLVAAPLPAGALLMLTGLGALAVARRAKPRRT